MKKKTRIFLKGLMYLRDFPTVLLSEKGIEEREKVFKDNEKVMEFLNSLDEQEYFKLRMEVGYE